MTVAESLRKIRKEHKLTQQSVADVLGIHRTAYTLYETGATYPSVDNIFKLASIYNVKIDYLLGREEGNEGGRSAAFVSEGDIDPMAYLKKDEQNMLICYRVLGSEDKEKISKMILQMAQNSDGKEK